MPGNASARDAAAIIGAVLRDYSDRGFLLDVRDLGLTPKGAEYEVVWHDERPLRVVFDNERNTLALEQLLPKIAVDSSLYKDLRKFIRAFGSTKRPAHRRTDPDKAAISCRNRGSAVTVMVGARDDDLDYATRRLLQAVHEIFIVFFADSEYSDYEFAQIWSGSWV